METANRSFRRVLQNHSNALPNYLIALDTETERSDLTLQGTSFSHKLRLGVAIVARLRDGQATGEKTTRFKTPDELWKLIVKTTGPRHTTWLIAHNLLFDFIVSGFPTWFAQGRLSIDWPRTKRRREDNREDNVHQSGLCVIDSPPTIIACRVGENQGRIVLVDTLNWFPQTLKELGKASGLEKSSLPAWRAPDEVWFDYCEQDTRIIFESFIKLIGFVREHKLGLFRYTGSAQAMSAYRHRFIAHNIYYHTEIEVKQLERQSYFGGRVEVFRIGKIKGPIFHLDINSLFPSVMAVNEFPKALNRFDIAASYSYVLPSIKWGTSIAEVELNTQTPIYPFRTSTGVIFPVGIFRTTLAGPELDYAREAGDIVAVKSWAEYSTKPLFAAWVNELWELRETYKRKGNTLYEQFCKRLLNSLYGKFGQRSAAWVNDTSTLAGLPWEKWTELDLTTGTAKEFRSFGYQIQQKHEKTEIDGTFPAISSFTTSFARMRMNLLRDHAGPGNVFYQCVDGIFVNQSGFNNLQFSGWVDGVALGKLRLIETASELIVNGGNDYEIDGRRVLSGPHRVGFNPIERVDLQRHFLVDQRLFQGAPAIDVIELIHPWERSAPFRKGIIGEDGWIHPHQLTPADNADVGEAIAMS